MGQNNSKNQTKLQNKEKFKHLNKLASNADAARLQKHDTLHQRMLTPKMARIMKQQKEQQQT